MQQSADEQFDPPIGGKTAPYPAQTIDTQLCWMYPPKLLRLTQTTRWIISQTVHDMRLTKREHSSRDTCLIRPTTGLVGETDGTYGFSNLASGRKTAHNP